MDKLIAIQKELKAPKSNFNTFGKYHYRSCEDILEAVKPLLGTLQLTISDEIVLIGTRYYVKASVKLLDEIGEPIIVTAYAREEEDKKGMDACQITGSASSYARKYALNGLFLIDDTKDADTQDNTKEEKKTPAPTPDKPKQASSTNPVSDKQNGMLHFKMKDAGLSSDERKLFFAFVNPQSAKEASEFIDKFDDKLKEWQDSQQNQVSKDDIPW
jgi:hypothetical protein